MRAWKAAQDLMRLAYVHPHTFVSKNGGIHEGEVEIDEM
jgi:hypothetical protein